MDCQQFLVFSLSFALCTLSFTLETFASTTFDPLTIGVGARALGMGRAYTAVAENSETIFNNPAGLGEIDDFEFTSMSGQILEDVNYTVLGSVYPLGNKTALGIGFAAASVSGLELRDSNGAFLKTANLNNYVLFTSFGKKLTEKTSIGVNLKYFSQQSSENNSGNGSGFNLDLGFLQKGLGPFSWGIVGQNILTSSKLKYLNGREETLPRTLTLGTRVFLLGQRYEAFNLAPIALSLVADAKLDLDTIKRVTLHYGAELAPSSSLILRAGVDQNPQSNGQENNLTAGLSLKLAGIGFHYAYHAYTQLTSNAAHFFSLSLNERGWPAEGLPDTFLGQL